MYFSELSKETYDLTDNFSNKKTEMSNFILEIIVCFRVSILALINSAANSSQIDQDTIKTQMICEINAFI